MDRAHMGDLLLVLQPLGISRHGFLHSTHIDSDIALGAQGAVILCLGTRHHGSTPVFMVPGGMCVMQGPLHLMGLTSLVRSLEDCDG